MTWENIGSKLRHLHRTAKHATTLPATTVAVAQINEAGVTVTQPKDVDNPNKIFVQINNDPSRTISVWNIGPARVPNKEGLQVYLDYDPGRELKIVDADPVLMNESFGDAANTMMMGDISGDLARIIVPGGNLKPLRVRPAPEYGGLNVIIEDGIYQFGNDSYAWLDKTPIDLATVGVSSGKKRPVLIGIDPNTNTAVTLAGSEVPNIVSYPAFTLADYNELIRTNLNRLWLKGYERRDGVTTFQSYGDLVDLRAWLSPGAGGIASGQFFMPKELNFELTIPENAQVPVRRLTVVDGGALTVFGALDIF